MIVNGFNKCIIPDTTADGRLGAHLTEILRWFMSLSNGTQNDRPR